MTNRHNKYWNESEDAILREYYSLNGAVFCIAKLNGRTQHSITKRAERLGLIFNKSLRGTLFRSMYDKRTQHRKEKKEAYIASIDWNSYLELNDETIYILGYMWADGSLHEKKQWPEYYLTSFSIVEDDAKCIESTINRLNWPVRLIQRTYASRRPNERPMTRFSTGIWQLGYYLSLFDYHIKSYTQPTKILNLIPPNKHYLFFRGYSDGDGTIYIDKHHFSWSVSSRIDQDWQFMKDVFRELNIKGRIHRAIRSRSATASFHACGNRASYEWCRYLYQDYENNPIGLPRKYIRFQQEEQIERKRSDQILPQ
jgi:hypothetical protein